MFFAGKQLYILIVLSFIKGVTGIRNRKKDELRKVNELDYEKGKKVRKKTLEGIEVNLFETGMFINC